MEFCRIWKISDRRLKWKMELVELMQFAMKQILQDASKRTQRSSRLSRIEYSYSVREQKKVKQKEKDESRFVSRLSKYVLLVTRSYNKKTVEAEIFEIFTVETHNGKKEGPEKKSWREERKKWTSGRRSRCIVTDTPSTN